MQQVKKIFSPQIDSLSQNSKVYVETWGCQMNVADSEDMVNLLEKQGYKLTTKIENANLIILNTCHIREKARHKVLSRLGVLKTLKLSETAPTIAVTGCVAQAEGRKLLAKNPLINILLGPGKISELPALINEHKKTKKQVFALGFKRKSPPQELQNPQSEEPKLVEDLATSSTVEAMGRTPVSRFLTIQRGCDNFCTFCVVPRTRGKEVSESAEKIYQQAKTLVQSGVLEVTLLGQNVNSYGQDLLSDEEKKQRDTYPFVDLLKKVASVEGLKRLRFTTSNPHDLSRPLAALFGEEPKLGTYFHLPLQSGSNNILEKMRRKVTIEEYYERVGWLRQAVPEIALSTDLIVGFPGESEEDFERTIEAVKKIRFSFIYAFKYSPRQSTAAARFFEQVPEEVKSKRLAKLNKIQDEITLDLNRKEHGKKRTVLFLYESKKETGIYYGRSEHFKLVRVSSQQNLISQIKEVIITNSNKIALEGVINSPMQN